MFKCGELEHIGYITFTLKTKTQEVVCVWGGRSTMTTRDLVENDR